MVPSVMATFGTLGPSSDAYLQSLADVSRFTGVAERGICLTMAKQILSSAFVRRRSIEFRQSCKSTATRAGKGYRDGAFVPIE